MNRFDRLTGYIDMTAEKENRFVRELYEFCGQHPEYEHRKYAETLETYGLEWGAESMEHADVSAADAKLVIALLIGIVRADRFCEGILGEFIENGRVKRWLERLAAIDAENAEEKLIPLEWRVTFRPDVHAYITMDVTEEEYGLIFDCAKNYLAVEECSDLEDLTDRLHSAAVQICKEDGAEVSESDPFAIMIPMDIQIDAEAELAEELGEEEEENETEEE